MSLVATYWWQVARVVQVTAAAVAAHAATCPADQHGLLMALTAYFKQAVTAFGRNTAMASTYVTETTSAVTLTLTCTGSRD